MKKRLIVFVASILFATSGISQSFQHVVKTGPIGLAFGNLNLKYEKVLGSTSSIQIGANYFYKFLGVDINGYGFNLGYRYYFTNKKKDIPSGFYAMPQAKYNTVGSGTNKITDISFGAEVGYQWAFDIGITIDLGAGPLYHILTIEAGNTNTGIINQTGNYIFPSFTFAIGYAF